MQKQTSRGDNIITSDDDIFMLVWEDFLQTGEPLAICSMALIL